MPARPAFEKDIGGTLTTTVAEPGVISAATVSVYDHVGDIVVTDATATISGSTLSYAVSGSVCDDLSSTRRYRARWVYTIGSGTFRLDQPFDVVKAVLRPSLTREALVGVYFPSLAGRQAGTHGEAITATWTTLLDMLEHRGVKPHRIIGGRELEPAHAALVAWHVARNFNGAGSTEAGWPAWAQDRWNEAQSLVEQAIGSLDFYDDDEDLKPSPGEVDARVSRTILTR
jgi:hypothetical protein